MHYTKWFYIKCSTRDEHSYTGKYSENIFNFRRFDGETKKLRANLRLCVLYIVYREIFETVVVEIASGMKKKIDWYEPEAQG